MKQVVPGALLLGLLAAIRVSNALRYPIDFGFDAPENWAYIEGLLASWALPAPEEAWAAAHPPLFYYLGGALLRALGRPEKELAIHAVRLMNVLAGLGVAAVAAALVRHVDPGRPRRAWLAAGLVLALPAHVQMSAMLSEEILASLLISLGVAGAAATLARAGGATQRLSYQAGIGLACGLALLTKLSAAVAILAILAAYALEGVRSGRGRDALRRTIVVGGVALAASGWFYVQRWMAHGYLYPHDLAIHEIMHTMPPGQRGVADYLRLPLATWTDPQLLNPGLLHSVWGSTYVTVWFDGHRHFLPRDDIGVRRVGTGILVLALLPTGAFLAGLAGGLRRWWRAPGGADGVLVLHTGLTLAGYVLFTARNPWFATVKGTYLLPLAVPFAWYASGALEGWLGSSRMRRALVGGGLALLALAVALTFTYGLVFAKAEPPGLHWHPGLRILR